MKQKETMLNTPHKNALNIELSDIMIDEIVREYINGCTK